MASRHQGIVTRQAATLGLSRAQACILGWIAYAIQGQDTVSFPGVATLVEKSMYSRRYVQRILRELERGGFLQAASLSGGRKYRTGYSIPGLCEQERVIPVPVEPIIAEKKAAMVEDLSPEGQLQRMYRVYGRHVLDPEKRAHWREQIDLVDVDIRAAWLDKKVSGLAAQVERLWTKAQRYREGDEQRLHQEELAREAESQYNFYSRELAALFSPLLEDEERDFHPWEPEPEPEPVLATVAVAAHLPLQGEEQRRLQAQIERFRLEQSRASPGSRQWNRYERLITSTEYSLGNLLLPEKGGGNYLS